MLQGFADRRPGRRIPHPRGLVSGRGHHPRAVGAERRAVDRSSCCKGLPIGAPVAASHTRAVLSSDAVTTRVPSGLNAALQTGPSCCKGLPIGAPVAASHTRAVLSSDAVTTRAPSGLNAAL